MASAARGLPPSDTVCSRLMAPGAGGLAQPRERHARAPQRRGAPPDRVCSRLMRCILPATRSSASAFRAAASKSSHCSNPETQRSKSAFMLARKSWAVLLSTFLSNSV